ncbi:DNA-binding protein [Rhodovulum iodosum]|nr:DNA-binding protein [Rhodovulum robiginosum]
MRKKELIDRVVAASGKKKKDVKPVVEAMLGVLGASLSAGETMNLQPFGKLTINRRKDAGNGEVLVTKIRRSTQAIDATQDPLAEPAE